MKQIYLYLILLTLLSLNATAQQFQHLYGSNDVWESLTDGHNAYSGGNTGHFLVGTQGDYTIEIQRTDINGAISGPMTFNQQYIVTPIVSPPGIPAMMNTNGVQSIEFGGGSGFGVAGSYTSSAGMGIFYTILDANGNVFNSYAYMQNRFGVTYADVHVKEMVESVSHPSDLYITGYLTDANTLNHRVFVLKLRQNGTLLWGATYDMTPKYNTDSDIAYDIVESANYNAGCNCHEVIVVGEHMDNSGASSASDGFLMRLNSNFGTPTQQVSFYGTPNIYDYFTSITQTANPNVDANGTGFVIGGQGGINTDDMWCLALDNSGAIVWDHLFDYSNPTGAVGADFCTDIIERLNTNLQYEYYLSGYTDFGVFGNGDAVVIKIDDMGNGVVGGQFTYGDATGTEIGLRIDQVNGFGFGPHADGIALFGSSISSPYSLGGYDHFLVKAYYNGVTACNVDLRDPIQNDGSTQQYTEAIGEFWPHTFYDFPFLVDPILPLQDIEICWEPENPDGSNARMAPAEPKADKQAIISPNPMAQGTAAAAIEVESETKAEVQVAIYDMLGKQYYTGNFTLTKGKNQLPVDISNTNMAAGMYTVKITGVDIQKNILLLIK